MKTVKIYIKGMHCKSCKMLLEDSFEDLGVTSCNVNWEKGIAEVEFDPNSVTIDQLKAAVVEEGYIVTKIE